MLDDLIISADSLSISLGTNCLVCCKEPSSWSEHLPAGSQMLMGWCSSTVWLLSTRVCGALTSTVQLLLTDINGRVYDDLVQLQAKPIILPLHMHTVKIYEPVTHLLTVSQVDHALVGHPLMGYPLKEVSRNHQR